MAQTYRDPIARQRMAAGTLPPNAGSPPRGTRPAPTSGNGASASATCYRAACSIDQYRTDAEETRP